jgi:hypothetical protein
VQSINLISIKIENMSIPKYFTGCILTAVMFLSCDKKQSYDIKGDPELKFFTNNESSGNLPVNSIGFNVVNYPDPAGSGLLTLSTTIPAAIKIPVFANKPVTDEVTVNAELDNSLVAKYNADHNTSYVAFPDGVLNTTGLSAKFLKGATTANDSITIPANAAVLNTLTASAYMAPIKLTTVSKPVGSITNTTTTQVAYVVLNTELRRIKYLAVAADALGALITPRTSWAVTLTPAPSTVGSFVDGSTATFSRWSASPVQVDVNLQTVKNITGIRLYTTTSTTNIPTQVEVSLSNDGINYDVIGAPLRANLTFASNYNYILFYKAIPAKYIRLKLYYSTSTSSNNFRLAELDVYAN